MDDGGTDRRALSVALAIADCLFVKRETAIYCPRHGEEWQASLKTHLDAMLCNGHVQQMVKQAKALVAGLPCLPAQPRAGQLPGFAYR